MKELSSNGEAIKGGNASTASISIVYIVMIHSGADTETYEDRV